MTLTTLCWIPKGIARNEPVVNEIKNDDVEKIKMEMDNLTKKKDIVIKEDKVVDKMETEDEKLEREFNLDNYDNENDGFIGAGKLSAFQDNKDDPYITLPDEEDEEDEDDYFIRNTDCVLLIGKENEQQSSLEVQLYVESTQNLYVHHDCQLPAFPLCVERLDFNIAEPEQKLNMCAVGTFQPEIEIWNLDVLDIVEPSSILGGIADIKEIHHKGKKKKKKKPQFITSFKEGSHEDAVLALSWTTLERKALASGSADTTVKLWDLSKNACSATFKHHKSKVSAVTWNPNEASVLLSGSLDGQISMLDVRSSQTVNYKVNADIEDIKWNPNHPNVFAVADEGGNVTFFDARKPEKSILTLGAHQESVTSIGFSKKYKDLLATCSLDKTIKLWDLRENPKCLESKDMRVGSLLAMAFNDDAGSVLAAGGSKGSVAVWDIQYNENIVKAYSD